MNKLTEQQKEIIKAISKTTIYTERQVFKVYKKVGSFDKTVKIMDHSSRLGTIPEDIIYIINDFNL